MNEGAGEGEVVFVVEGVEEFQGQSVQVLGFGGGLGSGGGAGRGGVGLGRGVVGGRW